MTPCARWAIPCEATGRNDLAVEGRKFSGNAFCKRSKVKQHHGTLLVASDLDQLQKYLRVDPRKLRSKGTKSVRSRVLQPGRFLPGLRVETLLEALQTAFGREYGAYETLETGTLPWADIRPYIEKHASWEWRLGETPQFDLEIENRFPWGNVQLLFTLRHTRVEDVRVFHRRAGYGAFRRHPRPPARLPLRLRAACAGAGGLGQGGGPRNGRVHPRAGAVRRECHEDMRPHGSPRGQYSTTLQTSLYLQKQHAI